MGKGEGRKEGLGLFFDLPCLSSFPPFLFAAFRQFPRLFSGAFIHPDTQWELLLFPELQMSLHFLLGFLRGQHESFKLVSLSPLAGPHLEHCAELRAEPVRKELCASREKLGFVRLSCRMATLEALC
jgi:hypothetical protein